MQWFNLSIAAGVSFAAMATLYRLASMRGIDPLSVTSSRVMLGACVLLPILAITERLLRDKPMDTSSAEAQMSLYAGIVFPIVAAGIVSAVGIRTGGTADVAKWALLCSIAAVGTIVVVCNVEMISSAAREGINPSFPLAVASACYLLLSFVVNLFLFNEMRDGVTSYVQSHWPKLLALGMATASIFLMRL